AVFYQWVNAPMPRESKVDGKLVQGVESRIPVTQYSDDVQGAKHRAKVVDDIVENWTVSSVGKKFHAILATSSVVEAIKYYRLFKEKAPSLKVTALFDPNVNYVDKHVADDSDDEAGQLDYDGIETPDEKKKLYATFKTEGILEILDDYGKTFGKKYTFDQHALFKRDLASRLAHKGPYIGIERKPEGQLDLVIVVDQLLTGYDSKWINVLYLDKELRYERLIQAFSRTNRLFGPDKPFGTIRYYRYPHTMERNVEEAFKLYSGEKPFGIFVDKLESHLEKLNETFTEIQYPFVSDGIENFERLPQENEKIAKFAYLFPKLKGSIHAAKIQRFSWEEREYSFDDGKGGKKKVFVKLDENTYYVLALRYKEIPNASTKKEEIPFDIDASLTEIDVGKIDSDYLNSRFEKYYKALQTGEEVDAVLVDHHRQFGVLTQEEQRCANNFLHDVQQGNVFVEPGKTFREYVAEYSRNDKLDRIRNFADALGLNFDELRFFIEQHRKGEDVRSFNKFDKLAGSIDKGKARAFLESKLGKTLKPFQVSTYAKTELIEFIESEAED
ncbi:MAG: hypothetical protein IKX88_03225, partial [Thermoguttaceae bacterium]|nr:hypothetical protein [Thermoguttaceae bacterium]